MQLSPINEQRNEIVNKILKQYVQTIADSQMIADFEEPSKLMMQQVCNIVKPGHLVRLMFSAMP